MITATMLLAVEGAAAQDTPDQGTLALEPIVVQGAGGADDRATIIAPGSAVGSKTDTPILDVPASVSVVTEKEMKQRGVESLDDALAYTSGVVTDIYGSDNRYDFYLIRGFYQTSLGTYRDGLPMRIPGFVGSRVEPYGMERFEVLKGSTSTLFGLNAPGGLVNAVTKKPLSYTFGEAYGTFGDGHVEGGTDFGGPIDPEGKWLYRFTAKGQDGSDGTDHSNDDRIYVAPAVTWRPTDRTELTVFADYYKRDGNTSHGIPLGSGIDPDTYLGEPDFDKMDTEEWNLGYRFSHTFENGLQFRQGLRYTDLGLTYESVYGATADPAVPRSAWAVYGDTQRFAVDNQLQYDAGFGPVDSRTLVGLDYSYEHVNERRVFGSAPGIDIHHPDYCGRACITLPPGYRWNQDRSALGLYAQEEVTFFDRVILTLGGRYDNVRTDSKYPESNLSYGATDEAFTGRVGLTYRLSDDLSVYANYSESFQPVSAELALLGPPKPQEGAQYEVGVKYRPDFADALFTLALFDITQTNVPYYINATTQAQVGKVRVRGAEFEGKMALDDRLNLTLAYSHWDPEILEDGTEGNVGNRPQLVPENIASAWVDYTLPGRWTFNDLTIGAGIRYVGSTFADNANTIQLDARTLVDAMISYRLVDHATLQINATNLFDERYISSVDTYSNTAYYGDGRTVKATIKYTW
ncbi:TonB-dependent siderophore receptor [Inquilinus sp. NPDC058860]|uniref:TonB-dependent siderophore receptor n=1 Tax=Inquilinus sp. NPDC058860 TaxID=3346652 RepID=UPI0036935DEB